VLEERFYNVPGAKGDKNIPVISYVLMHGNSQGFSNKWNTTPNFLSREFHFINLLEKSAYLLSIGFLRSPITKLISARWAPSVSRSMKAFQLSCALEYRLLKNAPVPASHTTLSSGK